MKRFSQCVAVGVCGAVLSVAGGAATAGEYTPVTSTYESVLLSTGTVTVNAQPQAAVTTTKNEPGPSTVEFLTKASVKEWQWVTDDPVGEPPREVAVEHKYSYSASFSTQVAEGSGSAHAYATFLGTAEFGQIRVPNGQTYTDPVTGSPKTEVSPAMSGSTISVSFSIAAKCGVQVAGYPPSGSASASSLAATSTTSILLR